MQGFQVLDTCSTVTPLLHRIYGASQRAAVMPALDIPHLIFQIFPYSRSMVPASGIATRMFNSCQLYDDVLGPVRFPFPHQKRTDVNLTVIRRKEGSIESTKSLETRQQSSI